MSQVPPQVPPLPLMPSLPLLLSVMDKELEKCQTHFESLDTKAGIVLAFDGVLIPLTFTVGAPYRAISICLSLASAGFALVAYLPRRFPVLEPGRLRTYLVHEEIRTQLQLHDTLMEMIRQARVMMKKKSRMLAIALFILFAAAATLGVGAIFNQSSGSSSGGSAPGQSAVSASPTSAAPGSADPGRSAPSTPAH